MSAELAVQVTGLTKTFGRINKVRAVNKTNLNVPAGAVYGLVGQNGAGKSTLLKSIAGFTFYDEGEVSVLGRRLAPGTSDARLGVLIEGAAAYAKLDPFENLMNRALVLGLPDPKAACREALDAVGLSNPRVAGDGAWRWLWSHGADADTLSTGLSQRLGVALALVGDPRVVILDEPFNGIDPATTRDIRTLLGRLARERGVTVIVSSHTIAHLERICTHYGIMRSGRIQRELTADELRERRQTYILAAVTEPERAVAVLAEELPGLQVTMLEDGRLRVGAPGGLPDRAVFSQTLMEAGIAVTELKVVEPDLEAELVELMEGASGAAAQKGGK